MPLIKPDTSEAQGMEAIEAGPYPATIESVAFETSKKGNPMIVPTFQIQVGDKTRKRKAFLVISGEGAYGFEQLLRACHFETQADAYADKSVALEDKPEFNTDDLVGQSLTVVIDRQVYNGELRDYIKSYLRA